MRVFEKNMRIFQILATKAQRHELCLPQRTQNSQRIFQTLINTDLHGIFALRRSLGTLNSKLVPYLQVNLPLAHHFEFYCCAICLKAKNIVNCSTYNRRKEVKRSYRFYR